MSTRERVAKVMARVMEVDIDSINDETSPDNLAVWDSLSHVNLTIELEKEFDVKIPPEDGVEYFLSFKDIVTYLDAK